MSKAAYVIRQSQGTDDSVSLELQREQVPTLAEQLADEVEGFDFGNHTGFSIHTKDVDEERIDDHPRMDALLNGIENGEYDYLVAWDDRRIARDEFFAEVKRAVKVGGGEFAFVEGGAEIGTLESDVRRTVETHVKQEEIEKAKAAIRHRKSNGYYQGGEPFGLTFDDAGKYLTDAEDFEVALEVLRHRDREDTYAEINKSTGVAEGTISNILKRRDWYEAVADGAKIGRDGSIVQEFKT